MDTKSHYVILVVAYEPHWMKSKKHNELKSGTLNTCLLFETKEKQLPLYDMQPKEPTTDDVRRKSRDARMNPNLKTIRFQTPRNELTLKNTN